MDRLQLELLQAKAVGTNVPQIRVRGDNDTTIVVEDAVNRVLHHTPLVSGGFESSTMASAEARSDQGRGSAHVHTMGARVRNSPTMASPEARSDPVRGTAQDRE